ncbi:NucA/NucB deoxyribonuclease domain-containing protein [Spirillospora sp. CA-253888]
MPILTYDATANPKVKEVAQHIYDKQQPVADGGLPSPWGIPVGGDPLTRTQDRSRINKNRRTACKGVPPSCDEWPLASSREGVHTTPVGDWSARTVPAASNRPQGGITSVFCRGNRHVIANTR